MLAEHTEAPRGRPDAGHGRPSHASLPRERYEAVVHGLTGGAPRLKTPADVPTTGLLVHAAAQTEDGFMIFDIFESQEAFDRFHAVAGPIATEAGTDEPGETRFLGPPAQ